MRTARETLLLIFTEKATLLHRQDLTTENPALIAAAIATTELGLLLESRHGLGVCPASARQVVVVLVSIFF
jgi:hypothetical protein